MSECFSERTPREDAAKICEEVIYDAAISQIENEDSNPILVDAIPTIGKTTAAAKFAAEIIEGDREIGVTYLTHLTANRDQFEEKVQASLTDEKSVNAVHLPVLENDCPTARGEHGEGWQHRVTKLRDLGISPSTLHKTTQFSLPCGGRDCPYMEWWNRDGGDDLIIGHLSHAYSPEAIEDRIVIVDEDPEDAFQTRFGAGELHDLVRSFLTRMDDPPVTDLDGLKQIREGRGPFEEARNQLYEYAKDTEYADVGRQILRERQGHIHAATAIQALLEEEVENADTHDSYRITLSNGVEHARINENTVTAYNPRTGQLAIRRTPDFTKARSLVTLDGTPTKPLWEGRLGVELDQCRVLTDDCRQEYLDEVLGYSLYQTSKYIKPYSGASPERISFGKDRGLLHEIQRGADTGVGLITTKNAKGKILERNDGNSVDLSDEQVNHYRNIRGSNEFEGDEIQVGIVIGSPHPGPNELRIVAGLNGDSYESNTEEIEESNHHYTRREPTEDSRPYLEHFRENSVAQAVLRFGRRDGATVFIHTSAIPEWMRGITTEVTGRIRPNGEQKVIAELQEIDEATTAEVTEHTDVTINTVRKHLKSLESEDIVARTGSKHRYYWKSRPEIEEVSPTYSIQLPDFQ